MNDIVERIRKLRFVHIPGTSDLMEEACQEIERLRQFDRLQPIEPAVATPATHATPGEGSVHGESTEPVAWAILHKDHQYVSLLREHAEAHNVYVDAEVVPLYRSPTFTDEEREAVENMIHLIECQHEDYGKEAATLRKLLERLHA